MDTALLDDKIFRVGLQLGIFLPLVSDARAVPVEVAALDARELFFECPGRRGPVVGVGVVMGGGVVGDPREAPPAPMLVASFTVSFFLQNLVLLIFDARAKPFTFAAGLSNNLQIGGLRVPILQLVSMVLTVVALAGLVLFLKKTKFGVQMRAASQDFRMAQLSGVRANTVIAVAFVASAILAWIVSLLFSVQTGQLTPPMGAKPAIIGFVATVIGGLGSLPGAALGGFLVGALTVLLQTLLPTELREFREAFLFGLLLAVLLFRPQGLLNVRAERERV